MSTVFGMSEDDKREIIADFLLESEQHIHTLNDLLLKTEKLFKTDQEIPADQINMMFRETHTIKGSSAMLGFANLSNLTHEMETLLDRVRNKKALLTISIIEVLFTAFDSLNAILNKLRNEGNDHLDVKEVIGKIKIVLDPDALALSSQSLQDKKKEASDMSRYLPAFLDDTEGCVYRFNEILLSFEKDYFNPDQLNEIFRLAHTIKGSSGIIKCKGIESVSHRMEDLLADFRASGIKPPADTTALLFKGIDWIKSALNALRNGSYQEDDLPSLLKQFEELRIMTADPLRVLSAEVHHKIRNALSANNNIFKIVLVIQGKSIKDIKATIIQERLKKIGVVLNASPGLENIPLSDVDLRVHILYATPAPQEQVQACLLLDEIKVMSINRENFSHLQTSVPVSPVNDLAGKPVFPVGSETGVKTGPLEITMMKVDSRKLDNLMNLAGELVIARARFTRIVAQGKFDGLSEATSTLGKLSSDIQSAVMQTRMMPIEGVFSRFRRLVRDISRDLDKEINLEFYGEDTELDKKIIDALPDALTHMIRNAIDHGIESKQERIAAGKKEAGTIQLKAIHQGSSICIEIIDDGRGMDASKLSKKALEKNFVTPEKLARMDDKTKLNFIFFPGFSTVERVTGLSGRGVGMDVVKKMIESLNGSIDIETEPGLGSRFILKIPVTLAIIQALLVVIKNQVFAFPLENVSEVIKIGPQDIYSVDGAPMIKLRGHALSLLSMAGILGVSEEEGKNEGECKAVIVNGNGELAAIKADSLIGEDEIVVKACPDYFAGVKGISGASILGDGNIALIMDVSAILREV